MSEAKYLGLTVNRLAKVASELEIKNEKLHALVHHMHECMSNIDADGNHECYSCEYENADGGCDFERRMEELEVDA